MVDPENEELWKSYFYPETDVLINKFGEHNYEKLKEIDATYSFEKLLELQEKPLALDCGKKHLNAIHRYVFGDIYPFAGEYRKVNMRKARGNFFFIHNFNDMDKQLDLLFSEIEGLLTHCQTKIAFCEILAKLYTSLIYYHPFREGNGRVVREFLREFSLQKSSEVGLPKVELDWTKINLLELNQYIDVSHLFPSATAMLFMNALVEVDDSKKVNV